MADWIQNVDKEMEKKGTVGAFTKQATNAGMSVQDFAKKVKDNPTEFSERTRERAQFALNMQKIANKKKMEKGGKTDKPQGYNDKLNEDLGTRLGRESDYSQSLKDRRDESKAANKNLGRRAYSSVGTMDKGNRMFMQGGKTKMMQGGKMKYMEGGQITTAQEYHEARDKEYGRRIDMGIIQKDTDENFMNFDDEYFNELVNKGIIDPNNYYAKGGKTQGYDDRDRESIGERNRGKKSQSLDSRMRESAGMEKSMGRRKYADVSTMDKGKRKMAKGGYVYRESDDKDATEYLTKSEVMEFIDEHNEGFETNYKSIEDFNKGEQLANGVRSIEKRKMARGGSVKGKIDRDRYVKLRREKDKEIAKLKKEKGALRKETITKDKCDDKIEKVEAKKVDNTEDNNNQTLLVGGIAGILLGAFFIGR